MSQYTLNLPGSTGDLLWDDQGHAEILTDFGIAITSCASCTKRMAQRSAVPTDDGDHVCSEACRKTYEAWSVG